MTSLLRSSISRKTRLIRYIEKTDQVENEYPCRTLIHLNAPSYFETSLKLKNDLKTVDRKLIDKEKRRISWEIGVLFDSRSFAKRSWAWERELGKKKITYLESFSLFLSLLEYANCFREMLLRVASSSTYFDSTICAHLLFFLSVIYRIRSINKIVIFVVKSRLTQSNPTLALERCVISARDSVKYIIL